MAFCAVERQRNQLHAALRKITHGMNVGAALRSDGLRQGSTPVSSDEADPTEAMQRKWMRSAGSSATASSSLAIGFMAAREMQLVLECLAGHPMTGQMENAHRLASDAQVQCHLAGMRCARHKRIAQIDDGDRAPCFGHERLLVCRDGFMPRAAARQQSA